MQGLANELSKDGACDRAIFPDADIIVTRCAMIGNLTLEGVSLNYELFKLKSFQNLSANVFHIVVLKGDRCNLDFVVGCTDPNSHLYNPLANVDDGTCPIDSDFEDDE